MKAFLAAALIIATVAATWSSAAAQAPPTPSPTPTPVFNFDEVKEVVSELKGEDGRTHYVTLSEDTEGVARIRLSLFSFPAGPYNAVLFRNGDCDATATFGAYDAIGSFPFQLERVGGLVLVFFNTRLIGITDEALNSIYDSDGTSLAIYRPGDSGAGPVACARLDQVPGAPATGNSDLAPRPSGTPFLLLGAVVVVLGALVLLFAARTRTSPGSDTRSAATTND